MDSSSNQDGGTLIQATDAGKILGLSQQAVTSLCRTGKIRGQKVGGVWVLPIEAIESYQKSLLKRPGISDHPASEFRRKKLTALSFFSGAMGLDLGIEQAGFSTLLACENDKFCRQTIDSNKPEIALIGDINEYSVPQIREYAGLSEAEDVDLIVGGPPCQAFSTAGKRKGFQDERGNVFLTYLDIALEIRPKVLVIENVRGLMSCPMLHRPHNERGPGYPDLHEDELPGGALNFIIHRLRSSGYSFSFNLYNSANFGVPQIRERIVIVCRRDAKPVPFLSPTHSNDIDKLPDWTHFREAVQDLPSCNHLTFPEKRLRFYRLLSEGQNWKNLSDKLQREALGKSYFSGGGKTGFFRRLAWDKPAPTLVTHPAMPATDLAHPKENRPLSIEEYKRVQQFPDNWKIQGPLIQQYKQVGNAVPIGLGKAVGILARRIIRDNHIPEFPGFKYSRYNYTSHTDWMARFEEKAQSLFVQS